MITYLKLGGLLALVIGLFGGGWYLGGLKSKEALDAYKAAIAKNTATQESTQLVTAEKADQVHDDEISAIRLRVVDTPVLVRVPVNAPAVQSTPPTPDHPPSPRPADPGLGERDIRPGITALEARYESVIADCRRLASEWPK